MNNQKSTPIRHCERSEVASESSQEIASSKTPRNDENAIFRHTLRLNTILFFLCIIIILFLFPHYNTFAQERGNPNWYVRVAPFLWFSNLEGVQVARGFLLSFKDSTLQRNYALRVEVGKGRLRGIVNISNGNSKKPARLFRINDNEIADTLNANYDFAWFTGEILAALQIGPFAQENGIELFLGGRFTRHKQNFTSADIQTGSTQATATWIDPVVGTRFFFQIEKRYWVMFGGDIAGFDIGSEFTFSMGGEAGVSIMKPLDIILRYRYQEAQYSNGKIEFERYFLNYGVQQGWYLGLMFKL